MVHQVYLSNPNTLQIRPDPNSIVPKEIALKIFSLLKIGVLYNAMRTCRGWLNLVQDNRLWQREFALVGLTDGPSFSVLSDNVRLLQELAKKAEGLLQRQVKTAREFDIAGYPLLHDQRMEQSVRQKAFDALQEELVEKFGLQKDIERGFFAELKLYKLGLTPLSKLENFAFVLMEKYGDEKGWFWIASILIDQNNETEALKIIDSKLKKYYEKSRLIETMVANFCRAKKFQEAIDLIKRFSEDTHANLGEARNTILAYAEDAKDLTTTEKAIDEIVSEDWKLFKILNLIDAHIDAGQFEKAQALALKYKTYIDRATDYEAHSAIRMYVRLNQIANAWSLAEKNKESDDLVLYVLRNAFNACHLKDEAEKVIKMLPPKED